MGGCWRSEYMSEPQAITAPRWPLVQKTAKRPETNQGGREEEEKRLGISVGSRGPNRLRSAKRNVSAGRPQAGEKFQRDDAKPGAEGGQQKKVRFMR
jgi:hypothetical protein